MSSTGGEAAPKARDHWEMYAVVETLNGDPADLLARFDQVVSAHHGEHPGRQLHLCLESARGILLVNVFDTRENAVAHETDTARLGRVHSAGLSPVAEVTRVHRARGLSQDIG